MAVMTDAGREQPRAAGPQQPPHEATGSLVGARRPVWAAALLVAALAAWVAAPSLHYGFVYDDEAVVVQRQPFWQMDFASFLASRPWGTGRHVTAVSLDLDRLWASTVPLPFHATNLVLYGLLAATVLLLARRMGFGLPAALAGAAVFAAHPTHVDAVASVVGRAELLSALGVMAALLVSIRPEGESSRRFARHVLPGVALAGALAMHAKESALCLPLLVVLARFFLGPRVAFVPALGGALLAVAAWLVPMLPRLGGLARPELVDNPLVGAPAMERVPKAFAILLQYALLLPWPHPLLQDRSWAETDPSVAAGIAAMGLWAVAALAALGLRTRAPRAAFAMAWFPAAFAVTSNVASPIGTLMAERLLLLPSVAAALMAAAGFEALATTPARRRGALGAAALAVAVLFPLFRERAALWKDGASYFPASAAASPRSAKAQYDLGCWLLAKGDAAGAEAAFRRALSIVPAFAKATQYLAESLGKRGEPGEGARVYLSYLALVPTDAGALKNATRLLLKAGRTAEAVGAAQRLVALLPGDADAMDVLVIAERSAERAASAPQLAPGATGGAPVSP